MAAAWDLTLIETMPMGVIERRAREPTSSQGSPHRFVAQIFGAVPGRCRPGPRPIVWLCGEGGPFVVAGPQLACNPCTRLHRNAAKSALLLSGLLPPAPSWHLIHRGILTGGALRMRCSTPELLRLSCSPSPDLPAPSIGWTRPPTHAEARKPLALQAARHSLHYVPTERQPAANLPDATGV